MKRLLGLLPLFFYPTLGPAAASASGYSLLDVYNNVRGRFESRNHKLIEYYGPYAAPPDLKAFVRPDWDDATRKAKEFLKDWTIEELVTLTSGVGWARGQLFHFLSLELY